MTKKKQALLLIHGIGDQKPMDTLRGFVNAVWSTNTEVHHPHIPNSSLYWSKPDRLSGSFELRRLTTPSNRSGIRTDFFEFYWAHLIQGTNTSHVISWAKMLLFRLPSTVPERLHQLYWGLWVIILIFLFCFIRAIYLGTSTADQGLQAVVFAMLSVLILPATGWAIREILGDAARYLYPAPTNIHTRSQIRNAGVELIKSLHDRDYERIIIVGHSLGSVIGYDILTHAWAQVHDQIHLENKHKTCALKALEEALQNNTSENLENTEKLQRDYLKELSDNGCPWKISDFITLGSPLAHAEILLANNEEEFKLRKTNRELPTCPPEPETRTTRKGKSEHFSFEKKYKRDGNSEIKCEIPHHAALFSPTVWKNIYFDSPWLLKGDFIAGKLAPVLGRAIQDFKVSTTQKNGFLSHTLYWSLGENEEQEGKTPPHIQRLRQAIDL